MSTQVERAAASLFTALEGDTWVKPFFTQYRTAMLASIGLGLMTVLFSCGLMFVSGYLIDLSAEQPELGVWALFVPLAFVQVFGIGRPFLSYFERLRSHDWVLHMTSELRRRLYRSIDANGVLWTVSHRAGEGLGLLSDDIGHIQDLYLRSVFPQVIACVVWLVLSIGLGCFSWQLGLATLLMVGMLVFVVPLVAVVVNRASQLRKARINAELYANAYDDVAGLADWVFAQRKDEYVRRVLESYECKSAETRAIEASERRRELVVQAVFCVFVVVVLAWASSAFGAAPQADAATGVTTRAADWIAAFAIGCFPLVEVFVPLGNGAVRMSSHVESIERLNALDEPRATAAEPVPEPDGCDIEFSGVRFAYEGAAGEVLSGIDLAVEQGQHVAILGPSGAGKSTLLSLLRGDLQPGGGTVTLGGASTACFGDGIARYVGVIQQDTYLFNQTLFENLALENLQVTREQACDALEAVGLAPLLESLPEGLDTVVAEAGLNFSGGQRHRIALARVLLQDTPIVVLDEPCVSLDPMTESALVETLLDVLKDKTVIMVTHHLLGINRMDRVVFIENGHVEIDGKPHELALSNARYQQLLAFDSGA